MNETIAFKVDHLWVYQEFLSTLIFIQFNFLPELAGKFFQACRKQSSRFGQFPCISCGRNGDGGREVNREGKRRESVSRDCNAGLCLGGTGDLGMFSWESLDQVLNKTPV